MPPFIKPSFLNALPFYLVALNIPVIMWIATTGGWAIAVGFVFFFFVFAIGDAITGLNDRNIDPNTDRADLRPYEIVTLAWPVLQGALLLYVLYAVNNSDLDLLERALVMILTGLSNSLAGIVIAHELIHRNNKWAILLGDILLSMVIYSHFRAEHVHGHHRYVGTPRDPATARYNEGYYTFLLRVVPMSWRSAWAIEKSFLKRKNLPIWHHSNPFWRYGMLIGFWIVAASFIGGWHGVLQHLGQAVTAIMVLELTNYIEHYGLVRQHLGDGKYEHIAMRHSWNANHRITNYYLINLQRHSDHHYKPARPFPLLQAVDETEAPQLPFGYTLMALIAISPYHWRRVMNPRVRRWRSMYYPGIIDWNDYNKGRTQWPR